MSWTTIESDPGVFTSLVEAFGVKDVEVTELIGLDESSLAPLEPLHGLIFLFKYDASIPDERQALTYGSDGAVYFANQVINNACATQALVHVLLNAEGVDKGPTLTEFKDFTAAFPPEIRGETLQASDSIRTAHNSFARAEPFVAEAAASSEDGEAFHFVAYVPVGGKVYELDGLKPGPIEVGAVPTDAPWWTAATADIQRRASQYASSEVRFSLMGVCRSERAKLTEAKVAATAAQAAAGGDDAAAATAAADLAAAEAGLAADTAKRAGWAAENARRKHNFIPLAMELFKQMAAAGQLVPAYEGAKGRAEALAEAAKERRAARKATAEAANVTP